MESESHREVTKIEFIICSSFGLNTHVGDANFLIVTT